MRPSDVLSGEHRVIELVLACLERIVQDGERRGRVASWPAAEALDFFRTFADRCHHGKEEKCFFPAMEAHGFPRHGGPTGVMLAEHDRGRACVRGMSEALEAAGRGEAAAVGGFADQGRRYIDLLRAHIEKEDHCLFTMANRAFSEEDQRRLLAQFEQVEAELMGAGAHERYVEMANRLAQQLGVEQQAGVGSGHGCSHGR